MKKRAILTAGIIAVVGMGFAGCQSPSWGIRPGKPKPEVKSPADMDDIQLKAPPERYTKDDYLHKMEKDAKSDNSLAQHGDYGTHDSAEPRESADSVHRGAEKTAMRDPSERMPDMKTAPSRPDSERAPGFDDYPSSVPFAPGSIGDVDH